MTKLQSYPSWAQILIPLPQFFSFLKMRGASPCIKQGHVEEYTRSHVNPGDMVLGEINQTQND